MPLKDNVQERAAAGGECRWRFSFVVTAVGKAGNRKMLREVTGEDGVKIGVKIEEISKNKGYAKGKKEDIIGVCWKEKTVSCFYLNVNKV